MPPETGSGTYIFPISIHVRGFSSSNLPLNVPPIEDSLHPLHSLASQHKISAPNAYSSACLLFPLEVERGYSSTSDVTSRLSSDSVVYIDHPAIRAEKIESRPYQQEIAEKSSKRNTLVVLPTALGKTVIAALVAADFLYKYPKMCILMMAPTRPLVLQHLDSFYRLLQVGRDNIEILTGMTPADQRRALWQGDARLFFATPQTVRNDLREGRVRLSDFSLLIFDEAHRARKDYAYVPIAHKFMKEGAWPTILGLTASPGSSKAQIEEVCSKLYIEQIEWRSEENVDVQPYVHRVEVEWRRVELPESYKELGELIESILQDNLEWLRGHRFLKTPIRYVSRRELLNLGNMLGERLRELPEDRRGPIYTALVRQATSLTLFHAQELLETQGITTLLAFLEKIDKNVDDKSSYRRLKKDSRFNSLLERARELQEEEHPKVDELLRAVREQIEASSTSKVLVFTQYRDTASHLVEKLNSIPNLKGERFVGQTSKEEDVGLSQKDQIRILSEYRSGDLNVLVATCIAEEGLDIPDVDLVVFYEPIPSEIRYIQRKGRTGRRHIGRTIVLIAEDTLDIAYQMASTRRVDRMRKTVERLNKQLTPVLRLGVKPTPTPELFKPSSDEEEEQKSIEEEGGELSIRTAIPRKTPKERPYGLKRVKGLGGVEKWVWTEVMRSGGRGVSVRHLTRRAGEKGWKASDVKAAISHLSLLGDLTRPSPGRVVSPSSMVSKGEKNGERGRGVHEIRIEKVYPERAVVWVDEKWRARMEMWNFEGPSNLVKKNTRFLARGELYHENSPQGNRVLCIKVKDIVQVLT